MVVGVPTPFLPHLSIQNGTTEQLVRLREREAVHFPWIRSATVELAFRRESLKGGRCRSNLEPRARLHGIGDPLMARLGVSGCRIKPNPD